MKELPLFKDQEKFELVVNGKKLELEKIVVDYVDEELPTISMKAKNLISGITVAVVVGVPMLVIILAVAWVCVYIIGLCHLFP